MLQDIFESASVTKQELAALIGVSELSSIYEARQYLQERKRVNDARRSSSELMSERESDRRTSET